MRTDYRTLESNVIFFEVIGKLGMKEFYPSSFFLFLFFPHFFSIELLAFSFDEAEGRWWGAP